MISTSPEIPSQKRLFEASRDFLLAFSKAISRNDKIKLISNFIGYDPTKDFGSQEMAAVSCANKFLKNSFSPGFYSIQNV